MLAIAQLLLAGHHLDHADGADYADCALCLAGNSLDHATTQSAVAPPAARAGQTAVESRPHPTLATRPYRGNARAPPPLHA